MNNGNNDIDNEAEWRRALRGAANQGVQEKWRKAEEALTQLRRVEAAFEVRRTEADEADDVYMEKRTEAGAAAMDVMSAVENYQEEIEAAVSAAWKQRMRVGVPPGMERKKRKGAMSSQ